MPALATTSGKWPQWDQYKQHFLMPVGRVVDWDSNQRTTSEAQSYALFFALVADDREAFDAILSWTTENLAHGDLSTNLPAWNWGKSDDGQWQIQDQNTASDADLWLAYTLIEAGLHWHDPALRRLGKAVATRIAAEEVLQLPTGEVVLLPGRTGFHKSAKTVVLNFSYLPLPLIDALADEFPNRIWSQLAKTLPESVASASFHGFAMDWVEYSPEHGMKAVPGPNSRAGGSYDAIRVYLWAGMTHSSSTGLGRVLHSLEGMRNYLQSSTVPPEFVLPNGSIASAPGPVGFSAALIPFLEAQGLHPEALTQSRRLQDERDPATGLFGRGQKYYDQNLALFATGWSEHRFRFDPRGHLILGWKQS